MSSEKNNDLEKAFELIQESISLARKDNLHFGFDFKEKSMDLMKALYYNDHDDDGFAYKYHSIMWLILNKPYRWWGTYYELDIKAMKKDLEGSGWDDYNEDGIPYWEQDKDV